MTTELQKSTALNFEHSRRLLAEACSLTPCGAQTYSKSHRYFSGAAPYFLERGEGGRVWDVDGNGFIDFSLSLGAVTIGYGHPGITAGLIEQIHQGISFSQATELEVRLAKELVDIIPCAQMVRFFKNGSDATSAAVRLARSFTGRERVAMCGYHGMDDWCIGVTDHHRGIPAAVRALTSRFSYNRIESLEKIFDRHPGDIAAVIMEPVQGNGPDAGFLEDVRRLAHRHGALLIFDEVVSGFRVALAGGQELTGVTPDLAAFGKGLANGLPLSLVAGREELLRPVEEGVFISSTFGGEALSLRSALITVELLQDGGLKNIHTLAADFSQGAQQCIEGAGLTGIVSFNGVGPHCGLLFADEGPLSAEELSSVYQQELIRQGILSHSISNFCLMHTAREIKQHLSAVSAGLGKVKDALRRGSCEGLIEGPPIRPIFQRRAKT